MNITLQDPHTGKTLELDLEETDTVRELALKAINELDLEKTPQFFTYFSPEKAEEMSARTIVDGEKVVLPDDITIKEIVSSLRDEILPIYFQSKEIDEELLFRFRTDRMVRAGYDSEILNSKSILVAGVGLLGNEITQSLAVLGLGRLALIDYGHVDWYNIYRQPLFDKDNVYQAKVDAASEKINGMGNILAEPFDLEIPCLASDPDKNSIFGKLYCIDSLIAESDIVIGALDIFSGRAVLQILSKFNNKPFVSSSVDAWGGKVNVFLPDENNCYCCGIELGKFMDGGVCTLASIEAQKIVSAMTTKFTVDSLLEKGNSCNQITYDPRSLELDKRKIKGSLRCEICGDNGYKGNDKEEMFEFIYNWLFRGE